MTFTCETVSGPAGFKDMCQFDDETGKASFDSTSGSYNLATTDQIKVLEGVYQLNFTEHAGDLNSVHTFEIELTDPCFLIPMKVSEGIVDESIGVNFGDSPITVNIPPL